MPVVKDADRKDLARHRRRDRAAQRPTRKAGKSKLEDLKGGTFTVTSIGGIGGLISTPIINHPRGRDHGRRQGGEAAGVRRRRRPEAGDIVYLSFSFDHRVVDGAVGAAFGNAVMRYLHAPALLLLPEKTGG